MPSIVMHKGSKFSTLQLIKEVLRAPGTDGVTYEQLKRRLGLLEALEGKASEADHVLDLQEDDYELVVELIKGFRFGTVDRDIVTIVEGILEPPRRPRLAS